MLIPGSCMRIVRRLRARSDILSVFVVGGAVACVADGAVCEKRAMYVFGHVPLSLWFVIDEQGVAVQICRSASECVEPLW